MRINLPNQITLARLLLSIVFFALLSNYQAGDPASARWILPVSFFVFVIAALSDMLDGWIARRYGLVTTFGRIVDPVVDKVLICGAFVLYASGHFYDAATGEQITHVAGWMAIVILIREFLVSAIRAHAEAGGRDFSADWSGKIKMVIQSVTAAAIPAVLAWFPQWRALLAILAWTTVIVTVLSIITYIRRAQAFLFSGAALRGPASKEEPQS